MFRGNLSSKPFYNERAVLAGIAAASLVAVAALVITVQQIVSMSSRRTALRTQIAQDQATEARANNETIALQHSINARALKGLALSTAQANKLIDERTFSWTLFFDLIAKTLPDDVRLDSVAPASDKEGPLVLMRVSSKRPEDLAKFIENLQATGTFYDVLPQQEDNNDDGTRKTALQARFLAPKVPVPAPAPAAAADKKAGGQ
jgi:hypothetical protein